MKQYFQGRVTPKEQNDTSDDEEPDTEEEDEVELLGEPGLCPSDEELDPLEEDDEKPRPFFMILSMKQIKMNITSVILVMSLEIQED